MKSEKINCPICNQDNYKLYLVSKDFRLKMSNEYFNIVKCKACNFMFLNPRPEKSIITDFYPGDFNSQDESILYKIIEPCFRIAQSYAIKLIKKYKPHGKTLDIGCGNGDFLLAMYKNGYDVYGVELNQESKKFCSAYIAGRISYGELKECHFKPNTFDIITMFQSLEHIYNLNELLEEIKHILKDDGILYICVQNADFFETHLFRSYHYNLEVPRHLYFFTKRSLTNLLLMHEFKILSFIRNSIFEIVSTPASFYHSLWNYLEDREILDSHIFKYLHFCLQLLLDFLYAFSLSVKNRI